VNHRVFIQVAGPPLAFGLILLGACLAGAWYINQLQRNLARVLTHNVANLQAAQELEISVRQLRFHTFLYALDPRLARREAIDADQENFERTLQRAKESAQSREQVASLDAIDAGYHQYHHDLAQLLTARSSADALAGLRNLEDSHPIRHVVDPCHELLRNNELKMEEISTQSERLGQHALVAMLALGLGGPLGGLILGYGIARGLSRSIYQLSVRVQDMAQRLDQDVASVRITASGDIQHVDKQLEYVVKRVEEVAERLQSQQREMLRAEQLSAVGQLAASVAHEIRNPLTGVKLLVEAAMRSPNGRPLVAEDFQVIHRELARLERTVQGLLDFAKLPAPNRIACDIRGLITEAVDLVRARADQQQVAIKVRSPEEPVGVMVDCDQFRTVFVNLFLNALDALPDGGSLEIDVQVSAHEDVRIAVSDSGAGIPPAIADRLFTPFASTKPSGTGLGLSLSRRIIEEHGGRITAANRAGGGASFIIQLPSRCEAVGTMS
jgi:signal transduction histidine kinase